MAFKAPAQCVATTPITLFGQQVIDGYQTLATDLTGYPTRVLVTGQTDETTNGIYDSNDSTWSRSLDADGLNDIRQGTLIFVTQGTYHELSMWYQDLPDPIIPGQENQHWTQL